MSHLSGKLAMRVAGSLLFLALGRDAYADEYFWSGTSGGNWSGANWSTNGVDGLRFPVGADAVFTNDASSSVLVDNRADGAPKWVKEVGVNDDGNIFIATLPAGFRVFIQ